MSDHPPCRVQAFIDPATTRPAAERRMFFRGVLPGHRAVLTLCLPPFLLRPSVADKPSRMFV